MSDDFETLLSAVDGGKAKDALRRSHAELHRILDSLETCPASEIASELHDIIGNGNVACADVLAILRGGKTT